MGQPIVITEPFTELQRERQRCKEVLDELDRWMLHSQVRDANGNFTDKRCKLCDQPPPGVGRATYRAACPCRTTPALLGNNRSRLAQEIRGNNPRKRDEAPQDEFASPPDLR